jgi:hypothetical protein
VVRWVASPRPDGWCGGRTHTRVLLTLRGCASAGEPQAIRDAAEPVAAPDPAVSFVSRCVPGVRVAGCRFGRAGELHRSAAEAAGL